MSKHVVLTVDPESEIGRALEDPEIRQITLEVDGRRFDMVEEKQMTDSDRKRYWQTHTFAEHLDRFPGLFEGIDAEQLKDDIARWRREGSREPIDE